MVIPAPTITDACRTLSFETSAADAPRIREIARRAGIDHEATLDIWESEPDAGDRSELLIRFCGERSSVDAAVGSFESATG